MYPSMRGDGPEDYEVVEGSVLTVTREVEVGGSGRSYGDNSSNLHQTSPNITKPHSNGKFHPDFHYFSDGILGKQRIFRVPHFETRTEEGLDFGTACYSCKHNLCSEWMPSGTLCLKTVHLDMTGL